MITIVTFLLYIQPYLISWCLVAVINELIFKQAMVILLANMLGCFSWYKKHQQLLEFAHQ